MPIIHKKPLGPRQGADWDLYPIVSSVMTIDEEDEMMDDPSWIDNDTDPGSKRVSSNDTISEPLTIHSGHNSVASSMADMPLILDHASIGPDGLPRADDPVSILLDIKDPGKVPPSPPPSPFLSELRSMEGSGLRAICDNLCEEQDELHDPVQFFERRLWALSAFQWLTFGKQLQSPAHETLVHARPEDGKKVLHLHGPVPDGWVLAAKYPNATFYSLSSEDIERLAGGRYYRPDLNKGGEHH
ncbi:hypothetical protein DRE_04774 [Drechslerella stenobrocha 248]|uniref:Uncharacterized protein n=1 Tax=Drechslerella stenobrocha 248 TaxID=1043628 RepID=W7HPF3_9PEZI|nr:hypothetical protein DRE_04774 [Drechslerella stenobrocha 248]